MMPGREADHDPQAFALEVVRRTREAWLPRAALRRGLNPNATPEPKRLSGPSACRGTPRRAPWASIAVAIAVVAAVLAGELWAVHAASAIDSTVAHRVVGDVSITLSRVAEASLVGPVD
ncbi:MAG TPA: hypothetical protein VL742_11450 [Casimicrobiaceae bacterium]|nr:hypothetical protein [Casimicrobiaceae bacterium]